MNSSITGPKPPALSRKLDKKGGLSAFLNSIAHMSRCHLRQFARCCTNSLPKPGGDHPPVQGKVATTVDSAAHRGGNRSRGARVPGAAREALRLGIGSNPDIADSAIQHGHELLVQGFTVSQVVHDYGDVCQSITELAVEMNAPISTDDFRMLNRCLDDAIAGAVTEYGRERNQSTLDGEVARGTERLGFLAHELRNLVNTAILAFEVLKTGNVGVKGSTGNVLNRSLLGLRALVGRSLAEVRLTSGVQHKERFRVAEFIDELVPSAKMEAQSRGVTLVVMPVDDRAAIEADRQVLGAVVRNLLQNAFKFTRPGTTVTLRVGRRRRARAHRSAGRMRRASWLETSTNCSARSSSAVPTERAWASGSHSADGAPTRTTAGSTRATCRQGMRLHHRPAANRGAVHRHGRSIRRVS